MAKRQRRQLVKAKEGHPAGEIGLLAVVALQAAYDGDADAFEDLKALLLAVTTNETTGPHRGGIRAVNKW